ncbi:Integrator complex subunit 9 [Tetrabaena socialis]|uniref:Integrator complex subunit 9 n=1 Tax=Tetrabaena socialis TaxID=47790 RepID=A0A2J7ZVJ7_9CHLO|nr:Integrator complex subunit 9 [Tetrabaena socialis]|eukprot:PNH04279.1 Integrator complex subunit 9 [Tetrabaena socialis]
MPSSADLGLQLPPHQEALLGGCWVRRASWQAVRHCLDRVRPVRYGQVVALDSYELTAVPYPSGSGFGHAVWQISDGAERCRTVLYMPDAAPTHPFAPPLPLEAVRQPDALLLGPHMLAPPHHPPHPHHHHQQQQYAATRPPLQRIKELVLRAVVGGGSVLIPVHATGEAWELLEALSSSLASADLASVPLLTVGARARTSLALGCVSLEALAPERQAAVYRPQHPFAFDALIRSGRLVAASSLRDAAVQRCLQQLPQQPAVLLAAADSLLCPEGPALELLLRLGPDPRNLLLLPTAAPPAALRGIRHLYDGAAAAAASSSGAAGAAVAGEAAGAPSAPPRPPPEPLRMRVEHVPLRGSGAFPGPSPAALLDPPLPALARESVVPYGWLHQVRCPLPRNVVGALVAPELLHKLQWAAAGPGLQCARLNCLLVFRGGAWHADPVPGSATSADSVAAAVAADSGGGVAADQLLLAAVGRPAVGGVLESLAAHGITRVEVAAEAEATRVSLCGTDAELTLRPGGAHIATACPLLRHLITECLLKQLRVL